MNGWYLRQIVRCKTIDLEVPAYAEMVIEGIVSTDEVEPEAPFGEALGYMGVRENMPYFTVTCITHRKDPIYQAFLSQFPPSESSMIRGIGREASVYKFLKYDCNQPWVLEVAMHESTGSAGLMVIKVAKRGQTDIWRTLDEASKYVADNTPNTRFIVAVDEDINARDADALMWATSFRMQPHRDCRIDTSQVGSPLDHSLAHPDETFKKDVPYEDMPTNSRLVMNATMKWPYPPVSLPKKEFMEQALRIWEAEKLPPLKLKEPWWGQNLGYWLPEYEEHAAMAVRGDWEAVGEILAQQRRKI
ncbi:UbiD family decarboxylase domain-containing protein [Thermodesulfobacteriota bacterium]